MHRTAAFIAASSELHSAVGRVPPTSTGVRSIRPWANWHSQPGGVHKYGLPRTDFKITWMGLRIKPTFALGSWIGFLPMGNGAMFMAIWC